MSPRDFTDGGDQPPDVTSTREYERTKKTKETKELTPQPPPAVDPAMFVGLLGRIVKAADPNTEADPVGVYVSLLAAVGVVIGPRPHVQIGNTRHPMLIWPLLFGRTGAGRKGEATDTAMLFVLEAVPEAKALLATGTSSGEGLIECVRDSKGADDRGGTEEKRLLVLEPEFGVVLDRSRREGNTIGPVSREAWSGKQLAVMNRSRIRASWSHIAIIGHITPGEFLAKLAKSDMAGGTFNRFLPIYVERSKRLPIPEGIAASTLTHLSGELREAIERAQQIGRVDLDPEAAALWSAELYDEFGCADDEDEAWSEFARRAAPYCRRIAALHAVLDGRLSVSRTDFIAAAALVRYSIGTAKYVLDRRLRDPKMDRLRRGLDGAGDRGMSRSEISGLFGRNLPKRHIDELLEQLTDSGRYELIVDAGGRGRPVQRYRRVGGEP